MTERSGQLPPPDHGLWSLVEALVDGTATAAERDQLAARLRVEPETRLFYVAYLDLHAQLQWRTRGESVRPDDTGRPCSAGQGASPEARPDSHHPPQARQRSRRLFRSPYRAAVAAAVALAAGLLAALVVHRQGGEEGEGPVLPDAPTGSIAVLINNHNTIWEADMALPTETGSALPPGRLKLRAGIAQVAFHSGGEVLLEGPTDFDVSAADRGFLYRGKLTAKVVAGAPAFRVGMPGVVVTELGGECGLLRDESGVTEIHVFEGRVGADPSDRLGEPFAGMSLIENSGARVDAARRTITPVPLNEEAFLHLRPEVRVIDAAVRGGQFAGRNFGTVSQLMVKNSIPDYCWETYLRFELTGVKGQVSEARVRLVPIRVGQPFDNAAAVVADNHWGETTLTWDNKPSSGRAFAHWTARQGEPVEFDVTRFVQEALAGDKKLSLRIFAPDYQRGKSFVQYGSRKGPAELRPQLLVTTVP
jgi:hypothetical protein